MGNFFSRLFGGGEAQPEAKIAPHVEQHREDPEMSQLREKKFRVAFNEYLGRSVSDQEFLMVKNELGVEEDGSFPRLTSEESRVRVLDVAQALGWNPEFVPEGDVYAPMGNRQGTFEKALSKALGGVMTEDDLEDARAMFEGDKKTQEAWGTMFGHDIENYATKLAVRIQRERLRRSNPDQDYGVAAK